MNYKLRTATMSKAVYDLGTTFEDFANVTIYGWDLFDVPTRAYVDCDETPAHPDMEIMQGDDVRGFVPLTQLIPKSRLYKVRRV